MDVWRRPLNTLIFALSMLLAVVYCVAVFRSRPMPAHAFAPGSNVLVIAHRGGMMLGPEHTLATYQRAFRVGADAVEIDLRRTKDGVLVALHDATLQRTTNGTGTVTDLPVVALKRLDAAFRWTPDGVSYPHRSQGYRIPTAQEIFTALEDKIVVVEIKEPTIETATLLCGTLRRFDRADRTIVSSFDAATIEAFRRDCPEFPTGASARESWIFYLLNNLGLDAAYQGSAQAFQVPRRLSRTGTRLDVVDRSFVVGARSHNMSVHVWTVNDPRGMAEMLDLKVAGIFTDDPERLVSMLAGR